MNVSWVRCPALETRWLARHERQLPVPSIGFVEGLTLGGTKVSGYYCEPWKWAWIWDGVEVPPSRAGTIILDPCEWNPAATLAHEFRHHWQRWSGWEPEKQIWTDMSTDEKERDLALVLFFRQYKSEEDALRYEVLRCPNEQSSDLAAKCGFLK